MSNESNNVFYFLDTLDLKGKKFVEINERAIPNIMPKNFMFLLTEKFIMLQLIDSQEVM